MTLAREHTALVVCDVQERLFPAMDADHREEVMRNIKILATSARRLSVPMLVTEQYPKGLGHTLQELLDTLGPGLEPMDEGDVLLLRFRRVPLATRGHAARARSC